MLLNEPLLYCALRAVAFHVSLVSQTPPEHCPPTPLPAEAWDALATLATRPADQSRQSTGAGGISRPLTALRPQRGRAGHPEGRSGAEDGAAVDAPGS